MTVAVEASAGADEELDPDGMASVPDELVIRPKADEDVTDMVEADAVDDEPDNELVDEPVEDGA